MPEADTATAAPAPAGVGTGAQPPPPGSAGAVVVTALEGHVGTVLQLLPEAAQDPDRQAHDLRVSIRRTRSTLRAFSAALDPDVAGHLYDELTWLARSFSDVRDAQVIQARISEALRHERAGAVSPSGSYLLKQIRDGVAGAAGQAGRAVTSARTTALSEKLEALLAHPPLTDAASQPVEEILAPVVRTELRRVRKRAKRAQRAGDQHRDELLHDLRKAAKRARYTCEVLEDHGDLARLAKSLKKLQDVLGLHNDCLASQRHLVVLADQAHQAGQETFLHGRLHSREEHEAEASLRGLPKRLKKVRKRAAVVDDLP